MTIQETARDCIDDIKLSDNSKTGNKYGIYILGIVYKNYHAKITYYPTELCDKQLWPSIISKTRGLKYIAEILMHLKSGINFLMSI